MDWTEYLLTCACNGCCGSCLGGRAKVYLTQKLSSTLQLFREGPAAQARKQFLNSSAGRWLDATFTRRAWAAGVIALLSLEPEDNRLTKILFEFFES